MTVEELECRNSTNIENIAKGGCIRLVYVDEAVVSHSKFSANEAKIGGAIQAEGTKLKIKSYNFTGNRAEVSGGSIEAEGKTAIKDTIFIENRVILA